jgi:hypothetical protein
VAVSAIGLTVATCPILSVLQDVTDGYLWWIGAWRRIGGIGMHRIDRGARIHHNNGSDPYVFAAGAVL